MSIVFSQDSLGSVWAIPVDGAVPVSKIKFGIDSANDMVSGALDALYRGVKDAYRDNYNGAVAQVNAAIALSGKAESVWLAEQGYPTVAALIEAVAGAGFNQLRSPIEYARGRLGQMLSSDMARNNTNRADKMTLDRIIQPLGLITGVSFDFQEPVNVVGITVEAGANQQLYQGSISGIAFQGACKSEGDSGYTKNDHGLEPLLEYFYHHRVTNVDKDLTKTALSIGSTILRGWVVGFSAEPLNMDYMIWKWALHLVISPEYRPTKLTRGSAESNPGLYFNQ